MSCIVHYSCDTINSMNVRMNGFTLIELLIVIAILGILSSFILTAVWSSRNKAYDARIRQDVVQMRWLAESVYDTQGSNYTNWSQHSTIAGQFGVLRDDIDKNYGDDPGSPYVVIVRDSQVGYYCASAPLRGEPGKHYCIDATAVFKTVSSPCPDYPVDGPPLICPAS